MGGNQNVLDENNMAYILCGINPTDKSEEILDSNEKCLELFECDSLAQLNSYCNGYLLNVVYEGDRGRVNHKKDEIVTKDKYAMQHAIFRIRTINGEIRWIEAYVNLNNSINNGHIFHMFLTDISEKYVNISDTANIEDAAREYSPFNRDKNMERLMSVLSEQYYGVFRMDLTSHAVIPVYYNPDAGNEPANLGADRISTFDELIEYLEYGMLEDEAKRVEETLETENIRIALWDEGKFIRTFKWTDITGDRYFDLRITGVDEAPYNHVIIGILDVTEKKLIEIENRKNSRIVEALSDDYRAVFFADAKTQEIRLYRADSDLIKKHRELYGAQRMMYTEVATRYAKNFVKENTEGDILKYSDFDTIAEEVKKNGIVTFTFTRVFNGQSRQYRFKAVKNEEDGVFLGFVVGFCDVEEEYRKDLETQALLRSALEEAKYASESKSSFLFNMSHDIRTPMNAILGFASIAQNEVNDPDKILDYLHKIESSGKHLLNLINDVLDMARIENGRIEVNESVINVEEHFYEAVDMFRIDMDKKHINFHYNIEYKDKFVETDALRVKQIELNLLGNALKYTKEGGDVWFNVIQIPSEETNYAVFEIRVKDTGIGMSEEFQKHVFDLFERENRSTVTGVQGTGLGLAITKRLAELMNGSVSCESTLGKGTEFVCSLRAKIANSDDMNSGNDDIDLSILSGKKVLLVEDNDLNREIARTLLEDAGMVVEEATDGTIAVEILGNKNRSEYDVVLMDIQMPYMDGYKATRIIRNAELRTNGHIPIIAMTANAFEEDRQKALDAGMDAHIAKPVDITKLYKELVRLS